jgi:hypothetical protein
MLDLNNRPGGPNLIVTAKTAHKVHFLDAATLTTSVTLAMPGSPTNSHYRPMAAPPMGPCTAMVCSPSGSIPTAASW